MIFVATPTTMKNVQQCQDGFMQCTDRSACIPFVGVCNGLSNCADGSDESHNLCDYDVANKRLFDI
jgi:hypothetical protein